MECSNITPRMMAYLAHELPLDERSLIRQHLEKCQVCQTELATLAELDHLLDLQPVFVPPIELGELILTAISQSRVDKARDLSARQLLTWGMATLAGFSAILIPLFAWWWQVRTGMSLLESTLTWRSGSSGLAYTMSLWSSVVLARQWLFALPRLVSAWFGDQAATLTAFYGKYLLQIGLAALGTTIIMALSLRTLTRWAERWSESAGIMRRSRSN